MFKGLGNIASLMKQAQTMGPKMQEQMELLKTKQVTGSAGGGMITVLANGAGQILKVEIDPTLAEQNDVEMISDLLPAAINDALAKQQQLKVEVMQSVTGDLPIPGNMENMLKQFMGGADSDSGDDSQPPAAPGS
ncbi:MAG: DNA-binding YbaB/EbfC family protein [Mariniblastus sp.]|jgi:DNA-binding YbaB/EbfC family protein